MSEQIKGFIRRPIVISAILVLIVGLFAFEPITRNVIANDDLCS